MKSKTIILSSQKKFVTNSPRAILTFISNNQHIEGKIRLYNANNLQSGVKLGIYYNDKVYTANLINGQGCWNFFVDEKIDLSKDIYCALIDTNKKNEVVLCGGTNSSFVWTDEIDDDATEEVSFTDEKDIIEDNSKTTEKQFITETNEFNEEKCKEDNSYCQKCKECAYKQYFFEHYAKQSSQDDTSGNIKINKTDVDNSHTNSVEFMEKSVENEDIDCVINKNEETIEDKNTNSNIENQDNLIVTTNTTNIKNEEIKSDNNGILTENAEIFLSSITEQLDEMFKSYPLDEQIMNIIPNSKVVKVFDSVDNSSYIVGLMFENDEVKYLLYGVPAKYNEKAPRELGDNYQWLPLNTEDPLADGYFVIYQDAETGKLVPVKVE